MVSNSSEMMNKLSKFTLIILSILLSKSAFADGGYSIKIKVNGLKDTSLFLANYYGAKQYYQDTAFLDKNGEGVFESTKDLPGGLFSVVLGTVKLFEFIGTEPRFSISTDTSDYIAHMEFKGSKENELFYSYMKYIGDQQKKAKPIRDELKELEKNKKKDEKRIEELQQQMDAIDKEVKTFQKNVITNNPGLFTSTFFKAMTDVELPETPTLPTGRKDSTFPYRYMKEHYFDNIDFSDERLLRTPIYHQKLSDFMSKMVLQIPDTINKEADLLIDKANANKEIFKYTVHYITNTYEKSNIMGMEDVFVHMAIKYYMTGKAFWIDSSQVAKITERATAMAPTVLGVKTPNIILPDTSGKKWYNLYNLNYDLMVLYFWSPTCGHCKKSTPKMIKVRNKYVDYGVEFFAVCTEFEEEEWLDYLKKHPELNWINVSDGPAYPSNFRTTYDIYSTPKVFLIDKDKKIIAKRVDAEQLDDIIERELIQLGKIKKGELKKIDF